MLSNMNKKRFAIFIAVLVAGITVIYLSAVDPTYSARPFDSDLWKKGDARTRGEMMIDLVKRPQLMKGKSKEDIIALLGAGDEREGDFYYTIDMGVRIGFKPSFFDFTLDFDKSDRVVSFDIVEITEPARSE